MAECPKVNASPAITLPVAFARKGSQALSQALSKYPVSEKLSALTAHPMAKKLHDYKEFFLVFLGFALLLHGSHFKNLLLCTQVVLTFLYDRVKGSVLSIWDDVTKAQEKLKADEPAEETSSKDPDEQSKHAKKREEKKKAGQEKGGAEKAKEDAEHAKKVLKALDHDKLASAGLELLAALMACVLVIHGGLAQKIAIANGLVLQVVDKVESVLEFPGYEDLQGWTRLLVRVALYLVAIPTAIVAAPLALAFNASATGAHLFMEHGVGLVGEKLKVSPEFRASPKGLLMLAGLTAFGALYQIWSWAADSGVAWYYQLIYLPAVIAEGLLSLV